ncbi:MAG: hypothetical protein KKE20_05565 [Nanoarchaeota archaeon]|nr:hypothetical protein [Nanoarchaeota archaeon]
MNYVVDEVKAFFWLLGQMPSMIADCFRNGCKDLFFWAMVLWFDVVVFILVILCIKLYEATPREQMSIGIVLLVVVSALVLDLKKSET